MARARPVHVPAPGQLTLDDWAQTLSAQNEVAGPARRAACTESARRDSGARPPDALVETAARHHSAARELLEMPGALLTRTHLRELGLEPRAVDAVFRALPVVALPGYSRPLIRVEQYLELVEEFTFRDDRVRPMQAHG